MQTEVSYLLNYLGSFYSLPPIQNSSHTQQQIMADYTLYQLRVMYEDARKIRSEQYKILGQLIRYRNVEERHYSPFFKSL